MISKDEEQNAFGFTFISEDEYTAYEKTLKDQVATHSIVANKAQEKLNKIIALVWPLLDNLVSDPTKIYIKWPNRGERIQAFRTKIQNILEE